MDIIYQKNIQQMIERYLQQNGSPSGEHVISQDTDFCYIDIWNYPIPRPTYEELICYELSKNAPISYYTDDTIQKIKPYNGMLVYNITTNRLQLYFEKWRSILFE